MSQKTATCCNTLKIDGGYTRKTKHLATFFIFLNFTCNNGQSSTCVQHTKMFYNTFATFKIFYTSPRYFNFTAFMYRVAQKCQRSRFCIVGLSSSESWAVCNCVLRIKWWWQSYFQNLFTGTRRSKLATRWTLKIPPHLKRFATLPCDMIMSEK